MSHLDSFNIPDRTTIDIQVAHYDPETMAGLVRQYFVATSPQWPGMGVEDLSLPDAVIGLLHQISDARPLADHTLAALARAGYAPEVVDAWDRYIRGPRLRWVRNDGHQAVALLADYAREPVPLVQACQFLALAVSPRAAAQILAAGLPPEAATDYVEELGDVNDRGRDVDDLYVDDWIAEWVVSGIAVERARVYSSHFPDPWQTGPWESLVNEHGITCEELNLLLQARFAPEAVRQLGHVS